MAAKKKAKDVYIGTGSASKTRMTVAERRKTNCVKSGGKWDAKNLRCDLG